MRIMNRRVAPLLISALLCGAPTRQRAQANTPESSAPPEPARLPEFEAATVKPSNPNGGAVGLYTYPGGRMLVGYSSLKMMIEFAFDLQPFQIQGGPSWIDKDRFDVMAIPPDSSPARQLIPAAINAPPSNEQRKMLQSLLMDRFGLRFHVENREGRVYWMVRTSKLKLTETKDKNQLPFMSVLTYHDGVGNGQMVGKNASMGFMAQRLSGILGFTVVDRTGIDGSFDFDLPPLETANADTMNSTLEGLRLLGLNLKPAKGQVQVLIVDNASKPNGN